MPTTFSSARRPLDGLRVVDTSTGPAGGLATMVLADFGADVVKVEPPGGDRFRSMASSPLWLRGKRSVVRDLHLDAEVARLHALVRDADVLVVSGPPSRAAGWGLDPSAAAVLAPSLIHCSVTGWGPTGPLAGYPAYATTVAARAGRMLAFTGQRRRLGPSYAALPVAVHAAAHGAVQGVLAALRARAQDGAGARVETSLLQGLLPHDLVELLFIDLETRYGASPRPVIGEMPTLNYHPVLAADDRWIQCGNLLEHLFLSFLDAIDLLGELFSDERFLESPATWSADATEYARDRILERIRERPADEWMEIFAKNGNVAAEEFLTPDQALSHEDLLANASIVRVDDPAVGPVTMVGPIARLRTTPASIKRSAPMIGAHTELSDAGTIWASRTRWADTGSSASRDGGAAPAGQDRVAAVNARRGGGASDAGVPHDPSRPLAGVTIVEFAAVIAAPLGVSMLADLGARVIRVEPIEGDSFRGLYPRGTMTVKTTAGKESICLDLKKPEGRAIAQQLIVGADVLVHNYRPGVPERLGIGFDDLHTRHPGLVWVSVNGYGPDGPSAHRPATHPVAGAAMGGAGYQAGAALTMPCSSVHDIREAARQIMRANDPNPDPNTSVIVASAVLLALLERDRSGVGQAVEVDMMTANAHANFDAFLSYAGIPSRPAVDSDLFGTGPGNRLYDTADGWVMFTATTEGEWARFCRAAGRDDLVARSAASGAAGADTGAVGTGDDALVAALADLFTTRSADEWETLLAPFGVACVRADAMTPGRFFAQHEQMLANGFAPVADHARFGPARRWGPLVTVNGPADAYGPGVLAGEHTDRLLAELGHDADEIAVLRATGVVASEPIAPYRG